MKSTATKEPLPPMSDKERLRFLNSIRHALKKPPVTRWDDYLKELDAAKEKR